MSPPVTPGIPGQRLPAPSDHDESPLRRVRLSIEALESRLGGVESAMGDLPQMRADLADINLGVKAFKALLNGLGSKLIVGVLGASAATFGLTKATEQKPEPAPTVVVRSAFDRALDACKALPDTQNNLGSSPQADCIVRVIREH